MGAASSQRDMDRPLRAAAFAPDTHPPPALHSAKSSAHQPRCFRCTMAPRLGGASAFLSLSLRFVHLAASDFMAHGKWPLWAYFGVVPTLSLTQSTLQLAPLLGQGAPPHSAFYPLSPPCHLA